MQKGTSTRQKIDSPFDRVQKLARSLTRNLRNEIAGKEVALQRLRREESKLAAFVERTKGEGAHQMVSTQILLRARVRARPKPKRSKNGDWPGPHRRRI